MVEGDIDILLNNAGLALGLNPAHETDLDEWENRVATNIKSLLYLTRLVLPAMVARGKGHFINIGSVAGSWPSPGGNTYRVTKAFVHQSRKIVAPETKIEAAIEKSVDTCATAVYIARLR